MSTLEKLKKFYRFLKQDTWQSWIVSLVLIVIIIKFIFFPLLSFVTSSPLPLVVVESCSMYHESGFDPWWESNSAYYESFEITKDQFLSFPFKNGLNKGDIILVIGKKEYNKGDIIIFKAKATNPIIHRIITLNQISTKGDHNSGQLEMEKDIPEESIIGKSLVRIPLIGWLKLIFFEPLRPREQRGFCK